MSTYPTTKLHYAANGNFSSNGTFLPAQDGYNLADVSDPSTLASLPAGVKGVYYLGDTSGNTAAFEAQVNAVASSPNLYAFYLADEPDGNTVSAANLKAESDYIHGINHNLITFITEYNQGGNLNPSYDFNPANTDINQFGIEGYAFRDAGDGGANLNNITAAVNAAVSAGIPKADIIPVYQAFGATSGAYSSWTVPTTAQVQQELAQWGSLVPNPAWDYAYSFGAQEGDNAISNTPSLAAAFGAYNAGTLGSSSPTPPPPVHHHHWG